MLICPIRYHGGAHPEDLRLWRELRQRFRGSTTQLLGFVSVSSASYWVDEFNAVPGRPANRPR